MKFKSVLAAAALPAFAALGACGGNSQADNAAAQLEQAAEQSDPAAAQVLENAADNVQEMEGAGAMNAAEAALDEAANAQAATATPPSKAQPDAPAGNRQ